MLVLLSSLITFHSSRFTLSKLCLLNYAANPWLETSLDHVHKKLRSDLQLLNNCVIHSFRHTFLTRLGEAPFERFTNLKQGAVEKAETNMESPESPLQSQSDRL